MIIDTHVHMTDGKFRNGDLPGLTVEETLELMDESKVEKIWVSPTSGLYGIGEYREANQALHDFCKRNEKRFIGFFTVNPNYGCKTLDEIKRCVEIYGFKGLKLHTWLQGCPITHPSISLITEECIKHNLPILFHDGSPPYASTLQVANLAFRYPEATIILGHSGLIETYDNAIHAANKYKNIYLSLCGPSIFQLQKIIDRVSNDKIMFGSDFGFGKSMYPLKNRLDMFNYVTMDDETKERLFYKNAEKLIS
ncbi:MAG: amidohydrolase [Firmicutes bacterium]|nr:amidohydrolase [Bacillota bacterium]